MKAVLPGLPLAKFQAVCTGVWNDRRLVVGWPSQHLCATSAESSGLKHNFANDLQAYITGNAFVILTGHDSILQTIYDDDDDRLEAIAIDEASGKIATCTGSSVRVYKPYGHGEDALKVR